MVMFIIRVVLIVTLKRLRSKSLFLRLTNMSSIDAAIIKALVEHIGGDSSGIPDGPIGGSSSTIDWENLERKVGYSFDNADGGNIKIHFSNYQNEEDNTQPYLGRIITNNNEVIKVVFFPSNSSLQGGYFIMENEYGILTGCECIRNAEQEYYETYINISNAELQRTTTSPSYFSREVSEYHMSDPFVQSAIIAYTLKCLCK